MGLFFRNYDKPGPGVKKDEPPKRGFFRFFDIFTRKFGHFVRANLLYSLFLIPTYLIIMALMYFIFGGIIGMNLQESIPNIGIIVVVFSLIFANFYVSIIGAGPATAGITYIMRNFANEQHAWIWSDFKDTLKSNLKQSLIFFFIDILIFAIMYITIVEYINIGGTIALGRYFLYIFGVVIMLMHLYVYPMMITFKLSVKNIIKNSLIFTLAYLPLNLLIAIILVAVHIGIPVAIILIGGNYYALFLAIYFLAEIFVLQTFSSFMVNFMVYPKIKKHMLDVAEKETKKD